MNSTDYYSILGLKINANQEEIKAAYKKLALINHPDYNNNSTESNYRFIIIKNAYEILSNSSKKLAYDKFQKKHTENIKPQKNGSSGFRVVEG